ncbi:hypothetical protein M011DRAFT_224768 [Sporormia fimetaria CBS 119925]|uniref:Uncharacterized protein n=1 Tax=Sporormia fimetaria CBS 119925 TaxID=1340428 RepID=A0A6A6V0S6_9PLEO|nr:hypothetical protein M011DRAFT_224768 [Sporormia fimetaria CBS 119925]
MLVCAHLLDRSSWDDLPSVYSACIGTYLLAAGFTVCVAGVSHRPEIHLPPSRRNCRSFKRTTLGVLALASPRNKLVLMASRPQ